MSGPIHGQVMACISKASDWAAYKVARQAMRYCQYQVAHDILKSLNLKVRIVFTWFVIVVVMSHYKVNI